MIRAVIVEDEAPARDKLRRMLAAEPDIDIVAEAEDGPAAARACVEAAPDVVFLDIQIPEITGLALAQSLAGPGAPVIVFVTAHAAHAVSAFDIDAVDYLLKPYDQERLRRCLERVRQKLAGRVPPRPLAVPMRDAVRLLEGGAVTWLEAEDNYVRVHTAERDYLLRRTLQDVLDQLGPQQFKRIHRSRAVNLAEIVTIRPLPRGDAELALRGGATLRVSRRFRRGLADWLKPPA